MKKPTRKSTATRRRAQVSRSEDMLDEYDFTNARKNPYAGRVAEGGMLVVLDADLVTAFPTSAAVNEALRLIVAAAARLQRLSSENLRG